MARRKPDEEPAAGEELEGSSPAPAPALERELERQADEAAEVQPPEVRVAMVVRGFRGRYSPTVHLAPRARSHAICGGGLVLGAPVRAPVEICDSCADLARAGE